MRIHEYLINRFQHAEIYGIHVTKSSSRTAVPRMWISLQRRSKTTLRSVMWSFCLNNLVPRGSGRFVTPQGYNDMIFVCSDGVRPR